MLIGEQSRQCSNTSQGQQYRQGNRHQQRYRQYGYRKQRAKGEEGPPECLAQPTSPHIARGSSYVAAAVRTEHLPQHKRDMQRNGYKQHKSEERTDCAAGVERHGQQSQGSRTGEHGLRQQDGEQQRALPEIASLGLSKEESAVTRRCHST